jgi:SAM-dependent methyltransferase
VAHDVPLPDDFRAQSRKNWGEQAEKWEARREELRAASMPVSAWMIDALDLQPGQTLLELAAGTGDTGLLAAELIEPGGELISSDFSPEMLQVAQRRAEELSVRNVRFKQIDAATSIDVEAGSIDGVLCRWGYMLMADPENALRETRRVLRPGGRVALAAWAGPEHNPWSALPARELVAHGLLEPPDPDAPGQFAFARPGLIGELLENAGFTEQHVEALDFPMKYRSAADWWNLTLSLSNRMTTAVAQATDDVVDAIGDAMDRHAEAFRQPDGGLRVPARTWVAWAAA